MLCLVLAVTDGGLGLRKKRNANFCRARVRCAPDNRSAVFGISKVKAHPGALGRSCFLGTNLFVAFSSFFYLHFFFRRSFFFFVRRVYLQKTRREFGIVMKVEKNFNK